MHYTGPIYRPPYEAETPLLEVTSGCTHNKCSFCYMYKSVPFRMAPIAQVEADLDELRRRTPDATRIFLSGGNAFALDHSHLARLAEMVLAALPRVETITMFARATDIRNKTPEELRALAALRISDLYIGTETGSDKVLAFVNKGYTAAEAVEQLQKLDAAGIRYSVNYLSGLAGAGGGVENARESAKFFNQLHPTFIGSASLYLDPSTPLWGLKENGTFRETDEVERLMELYTLLSELTIPTTFKSIHATNLVRIVARLPEDRAQVLSELGRVINRLKQSGQPYTYRRSGI